MYDASAATNTLGAKGDVQELQFLQGGYEFEAVVGHSRTFSGVESVEALGSFAQSLPADV